MHQSLPGRGGGAFTSCGVQAATAALALEVLGFLVVYQDFEIVEITLAVVAPRTSQDLLDVRVISLLFAHVGKVRGVRAIAWSWGDARSTMRSGRTTGVRMKGVAARGRGDVVKASAWRSSEENDGTAADSAKLASASLQARRARIAIFLHLTATTASHRTRRYPPNMVM